MLSTLSYVNCNFELYLYDRKNCYVLENGVDISTEEVDDLHLAAKYRAVTGVLASHPEGRDVHINAASITFHGAELLVDSRIELNTGRRYGLLGLNGCGKEICTTFLFDSRVFPSFDGDVHINSFPHTTFLQQTTLKIFCQKIENL